MNQALQRVALITGGGGALGRGIAARLQPRIHCVVISDHPLFSLTGARFTTAVGILPSRCPSGKPGQVFNGSRQLTMQSCLTLPQADIQTILLLREFHRSSIVYDLRRSVSLQRSGNSSGS